MDSTLIGQSTAEFMETLEDRYANNESAKVVEVMVIVQVERDLEEEEKIDDDSDDDDSTWSSFHYHSSDKMWSHQRGLVQAVVNSLDLHHML